MEDIDHSHDNKIIWRGFARLYGYLGFAFAAAQVAGGCEAGREMPARVFAAAPAADPSPALCAIESRTGREPAPLAPPVPAGPRAP